jgi:hypothetical protein
MYEIDISRLVRILDALQDSRILPPCDSKGFVRRFHLQSIEDNLKDLRELQDLLGFDGGIRQQIYYLQEKIDYDMHDTAPEVISSLVDSLRESLIDALKKRKFFYMTNASFYKSIHLFSGASFEARFGDAVLDAMDAETAYAVGLYTSCVFHTMRVVEHGLRFIAAELEVDITDKGKPCPIEFATWEKVLAKIEEKRIQLRQDTKSTALVEKQRHLAEAASHCAHLKDWFRNDVMHTRRSYNEAEAMADLHRVAEFMSLLSK